MSDDLEREALDWWARRRGLALDRARLDELQPFLETRQSEVELLWDLPLDDAEMPLGFTGAEEDRG